MICPEYPTVPFKELVKIPKAPSKAYDEWPIEEPWANVSSIK